MQTADIAFGSSSHSAAHLRECLAEPYASREPYYRPPRTPPYKRDSTIIT